MFRVFNEFVVLLKILQTAILCYQILDGDRGVSFDFIQQTNAEFSITGGLKAADEYQSLELFRRKLAQFKILAFTVYDAAVSDDIVAGILLELKTVVASIE